MSNTNRAARRRQERVKAKGIVKLPPSANASAGPLMSVYEEDGDVVIHIAWQNAWINVVRMSADDAENHAKELMDLVRVMRGGLVTPKGPSGLIVPGITEQPTMEGL